MTAQWISIGINAAIAAAVACAWFGMRDGQGRLSAARRQSLKFFTVLSNLLMGFSSAAYVTAMSIPGDVPRAIVLLKYLATVSVAVTFTTVMLFLGPQMGYASLFRGANLLFHLIVPLAAILDFILFDRSGPVFPKDAPLGVIPVMLYGTGYLLNLIFRGVEGNDWYGFARGSRASWAAVFLVIAGGTLGIAILLSLPR